MLQMIAASLADRINYTHIYKQTDRQTDSLLGTLITHLLTLFRSILNRNLVKKAQLTVSDFSP